MLSPATRRKQHRSHANRHSCCDRQPSVHDAPSSIGTRRKAKPVKEDAVGIHTVVMQ
jgi:hypothetical protein